MIPAAEMEQLEALLAETGKIVPPKKNHPQVEPFAGNSVAFTVGRWMALRTKPARIVPLRL